MRYVPVCLCIAFCLLGCKSSQNTPVPGGRDVVSTSSPAVSASPSTTSPNPNTAESVAAARTKIDACTLLTSEEINSIQGEAVKETKQSARSDGGFSITQCFFTLPTFTNSISLAVTQKMEGQGTRDPREFWAETFHSDAREKHKRESEGEKEDESAPEKVAGVGEEAFWMGSRVGGALYVLKGSNYLRISIGGAADQESKIKRSRALAQKVLTRL